MNDRIGRVVPECIREAREARGYTAPRFAEALGISRQALSQFEVGQTSPSAETLGRIIRLTGQPLSFFTRSRPRSREAFGTAFWRSLKRMTEPERLRIARRLDWLHDITCYLERYIDLPAPNLPAFEWFDPSTADMGDIERAAAELRVHWGLGAGPIPNLCALLEANGIVVFREEVRAPDMSAVSRWQAGRPVMCLSADRHNAFRSRFDAAHELAHLVLHAGVEVNDDNLKIIERQADRFAGAFLLPTQSFSREVISTSLNHFVTLKKRWKVSIQAMVYRCKDLGLLKEHHAKYIWRQMNARNMRIVEPLDDTYEPEQPVVLKQAIQMLLQHNVQAKEQIRDALNLNEHDVEAICGLPEGTLSNVVALELRRRRETA